MMYCERCNVDFTEGLRYCKWCGQTLVERRRNTSELNFCPNCSAAVQPKWAFCKVCGVRLTTAPREPLSAACPQCGTQTHAGALHCLNCGHHLQGNDAAPGSETPSTSIIALCPTCGERIDPGSVYCKGCGAALYEQATPFGESAIICTACQSFNPVGSTTCRVCGASLIVTATTLMADQSPTRVVTEKESSTLPDLADHLPLRQSSEHQTPTAERESPPPYVTEERTSPPPAAGLDSGAYTLTFNSPGTEDVQEPLPTTVPSPPPTMPAHPKGSETSVLPGVAGSKFEQPQPTVALHMNRDTGPVESEEAAATNEAPPSGELNKPAAPVTRIDTEGLAAHPSTPPAHETFTFVSDVDLTASDGTVGFGAGSPPPAAFESDTRASSAPFVLGDEAAPPKKPTAPVAPSSDTDRVVAETTQVIANAAPQTEAIADAARRYEAPQQATLPIEQVAQPPLSQSNVPYSEAHAPTVPAPAVPKKKSHASLLIGIFIALFFIGIVGGAAWWFLSGRKATKPTATVPPTETPTETPKLTETPKPNGPVAPEGMALVPAGTYTIGRDNESDLEKPSHAVTLPAYFIDRTEVTNEAYKRFVDETNHKPPTNWQGKNFPTGRANYPVTGITWQDAADYAASVGKRLPTEAEWEAAARGPEGHRYPWGDEWLPGQANIGVKMGEPAKDDEYPPQIMEVGGYTQGASPAGALDMIGNVWEWTADEFKFYPGNSATMDDPKVKADLKIKSGVTYRVIRGGAFDGGQQHDGSYRGYLDASLAYPKTGFRCVKDLK
jgi:formylglycine-generating enzyme required for sulfatase activity